jgi:acetoacetyl-CoA synthetase
LASHLEAAPDILWRPIDGRLTRAAEFAGRFGAALGRDLGDHWALHSASVEHRAAFWPALWDELGLIGTKGDTALDESRVARLGLQAARFFPEARFNAAENMLRHHGAETALVSVDERGVLARHSFDDLRALVSRLQQAMAACGVVSGDRVAAMLPNRAEAVAVMLAALSMGAVFSSVSPDFGVDGVLSRFAQVQPKLLFACDGYLYAGKTIRLADRLPQIQSGLEGLHRMVVLDAIGEAAMLARGLEQASTFDDFIARHDARPLQFARMPFDHPGFIMFSSGTTGVPKCIVHRAAGALLKQLSEHALHCDVRQGDRLFYFSTLGWMMWNWLTAGLALGATLILYDGSPFHPAQDSLFAMAASERVTLFGTSAKFIDTCRKQGVDPSGHDLSSVRLVTSTGSPLNDDGFIYAARTLFPGRPVASISGGTDIVGCFVAGSPLLPVRIGEIQTPTFGLGVDVQDDDGRPITGERGELVCTTPFPSMPLGFLNDPDGTRFRAAYFERLPGVWAQGDFATRTPSGGFIIHGRSDATLNPGGVRIGTAEIYAQVERHAEIAEALCIGQDFDNDVRVILFVRLQPGAVLDEALIARLKASIRTNASPRHVPARIIAVADIPRTKSGKITELAVRDIVAGRPVKNAEAIANPEALALFAGLRELAT